MSLGSLGYSLLRFGLVILFLGIGVVIRLGAVQKYGKIIHEFDPWFNFRVTEYIAAHGYTDFVKWHDEASWWPIGRPVGTTTYPGMMVTSATIWHIFEHFNLGISLNDVCVFIPAVFSIFSCLAVYGITWEVSLSANASVIATGIMAVLPAHLMRSVAGGYDNESVAVAAICSTFYLWCRSNRDQNSWFPFSFLTAISYIYMVAAWGGYTFVLNMIGVHTLAMLLLGRYSKNLHMAYSVFYVI